MADTAHTRFVAKVSGTDKKILSAEEGGGQLRIHLPTADYFEDGTELKRIKDQKYSLHLSPNTQGNFFKQTITLEGGVKVRTPHYTSALPENLYTLLFARRLPRLQSKRFDLDDIKSHDPIVRLKSYDEEEASLFYAVVVSCPGHSMNWNEGHFNGVAVDFEYARVTLLSSLIGIPALNNGDFLHCTTGVPSLVGSEIETDKLIPMHVHGKSNEEIIVVTMALFEALREGFIQRCSKVVPQSEFRGFAERFPGFRV